MTKKTRKWVLYALIGLFFVLGAGTIFYAQGYRFDLQTFRIKKIGAIYVRTHPKNADVYLGDKMIDRGASLFNSGILIPSLFPKVYSLRVESAGYKIWKRNVSLQPTFVYAANAILIPEKPALVTDGPVRKFWALQNSEIYQTDPGNLFWNGKKISGDEFVEANSDGTAALTKNALTSNYFLTSANINSSGIETKEQSLKPVSRGKIIFDTGPGQFITYNNTSISLLSADGGYPKLWTGSTRQTIDSADASKSFIVWPSYDQPTGISKIFVYNKFSGLTQDSGKKFTGKASVLKFSDKGELIILAEDGTLYSFDPAAGDLNNLSKEIKNFEISPDSNQLAALSERNLEIFSLNTGEYNRINLATFGQAQKAFWYEDGTDIFLKFADHTGLLDLADINADDVQLVAESYDSGYDATSNTFYFTQQDGKLYSLIFAD